MAGERCDVDFELGAPDPEILPRRFSLAYVRQLEAGAYRRSGIKVKVELDPRCADGDLDDVLQVVLDRLGLELVKVGVFGRPEADDALGGGEGRGGEVVATSGAGVGLAKSG